MMFNFKVIVAALSPVVLLAACGGSSDTPGVKDEPDSGGSTAVPHANVAIAENTVATVFELSPVGMAPLYTLGGADAAHFQVDASGVVSAVAALDFEAPADTDADNSYELEIYVDTAEPPVQRLSVLVGDQLLFASPTLFIDSGTGQLGLEISSDDPFASTYQLRASVNPDGGSGFAPMDSNGDCTVDGADLMSSGEAVLASATMQQIRRFPLGCTWLRPLPPTVWCWPLAPPLGQVA